MVEHFYLIFFLIPEPRDCKPLGQALQVHLRRKIPEKRGNFKNLFSDLNDTNLISEHLAQSLQILLSELLDFFRGMNTQAMGLYLLQTLWK